MKTDLFQSCGHCWVFQICWYIECSTFTASSFRIWNSSARIPSPPLALFVMMLSKAYLTSHSRMSGLKGYFCLKCIFISCEKAMAPHSITLAWKIPWTKEPCRLQSMGSLRVGHDWATSLSLFTFMRWRRKWQPTPVSLPGESRDGGAWWAAVYGVTQSRTWLKWFSSSSSMVIVTCLFSALHPIYC